MDWIRASGSVKADVAAKRKPVRPEERAGQIRRVN
jgi:hypothetical protein